MLFLSRSILVAILSCTAGVSAFLPVRVVQSSVASGSSPTTLYISSWTGRQPETLKRENPEEKVQAYLEEPSAVEARANIDGTCLVSGLVNDPSRTDQFLFDLLNHQDSAFEFTKIVAFCNDVKSSKKRLLSRSARYTGLLDKLDFLQADAPDALPTAAQLQGVKSWIAVLDNKLDMIQQVADTAKQVDSLENIAVLLTNANELDVTASKQAVETLKSTNKQYSIVVVGQLQDTPEGKVAYQFAEFGTEEAVLPAKAVFSREESYRMITELLQLECGVNKALAFAEVYNVNVTEAKLIRGLREAGYARPQEVDHMIRKGPEAYLKFIEEWKTQNPDAAKGYTTNAWWEAEIYQKSRRRSAERDEKAIQKVVDERTKEIEGIAKEWAKREYFRQSMSGTINDMTEEAFIESVWERAMFEGDLKYRQMKGEVTDPDQELADFKAKQERKQQAMLKRAKEELAQMLDEEDLGGDEIRSRLNEENDEDLDKKKNY